MTLEDFGDYQCAEYIRKLEKKLKLKEKRDENNRHSRHDNGRRDRTVS